MRVELAVLVCVRQHLAVADAVDFGQRVGLRQRVLHVVRVAVRVVVAESYADAVPVQLSDPVHDPFALRVRVRLYVCERVRQRFDLTVSIVVRKRVQQRLTVAVAFVVYQQDARRIALVVLVLESV